MKKGFEIEYNGFIFNAGDYEKRHEVLSWEDEKPKAEILTAVNGNLDIISEGSQPEFKILFYNLTEREYKSILLLNSKITMFRTETEEGITPVNLRRIRNNYNNMFISVKPINAVNSTDFPALQVTLKSTKAGAVINGELIENVCFMTEDNYQIWDKTDEDNVIIYRE